MVMVTGAWFDHVIIPIVVREIFGNSALGVKSILEYDFWVFEKKE